MKTILTGSQAFFSGVAGFAAKDKDVLIPVNPEDARGFQWMRQTSNGSMCRLEVVMRPKEELLAHAVEVSQSLALGKFLTPAFAEAIGLGVNELSLLQPLRDNLDAKHAYQGIIYDAYIENGAFTLTDAQRQQAYEVYTAARKTK